MSALTGTLLVLALTAPLTPVQAQLADRAFQLVITRFGKPCKTVEKTQAIGTSSSGDALVAVACSGGGRHVVRIHKDNSVSYMTSCAELESQTGISCFAHD